MSIPTRTFLSGLVALAAAAGAPHALGGDLDERAARVHREAIVVDGHNDVAIWITDFGFDLAMDGWEPDDRAAWLHLALPWWPGRPAAQDLRTDTDLARIERGGLDAQFFSVWVSGDDYDPDHPVPGRAIARAHEVIDALEAQFEAHADRIELALDADDVRRIAAQGRLAALLGLEGGHAIEDDLENLRDLFARGVRYMTLTWSFSHTWADASGDALRGAESRHGGLTDFGRAVVREMNDLGMLVDVSHVSDATFWDALETSRAPVVASHSSVRALADHPRNLSDPMLRALAAQGGVVMINFATTYLDPRKTSPLRLALDWIVHWGGSETNVGHVADHIDHVVALVGADHVGLGSDYDGTPLLPTGLRHVGELPNLTRELLARGHDEVAVRKILGENSLRVLAEARRRARPEGRRDILADP